MKRGVALISLILVISVSWAGGQSISYPDGYRSWSHVKSMILKPGHPLENPFMGIHHVYANKKAVKGLETGHYQDGAILVFDLLQYNDGKDAITEGPRKLIGVMVRDHKHYSLTGGWGFEGFAGNSHDKRLVQDDGKSCFSCHESQKTSEYVFSKWRE